METFYNNINGPTAFLPLIQKLKHLSLYPLATSNWEIPWIPAPFVTLFSLDKWFFLLLLGWLLPCSRKRSMDYKNGPQKVCNKMDESERYRPQESVAEQKSPWWMFIGEANTGHCFSHLFVITFPSDTARPTTENWKPHGHDSRTLLKKM